MQKIEISPCELRHIRTSVAVSICNKYPSVFQKLYSQKGYIMNESETLAAELLKTLLELEPSLKHELEFYIPLKD